MQRGEIIYCDHCDDSSEHTFVSVEDHLCYYCLRDLRDESL